MSSRLLGLTLALLLPGVAAAATSVVGSINVDARWTKSGSPYRLTGDVVVGPGATLTIEPGVVVEAASTDSLATGTDAARVEFTIRGRLVADGTAAEPISFEAASATTGSWYGLVFDVAARPSSLTHASIIYGLYGIHGRAQGADFTLSDVTVSGNRTGLLWASTVHPPLQRVRAHLNTLVGIELQDDGANGAAPTLRDCTVINNWADGVHLKERVNATLLGFNVRHNGGTGIVLHPQAQASVERSFLLANSVGLEARAGSALTFRNNLVVGNLTKGLDLTQSGTRPLRVINNTFDRNRADPLANSGTGTGLHVRAVTSAPDFLIRNNIITNHGSYGLLVDGATPPAADHNNVWNNFTNYSGVQPGLGSLSVNPFYEQPLSSSSQVWTFVGASFSQFYPGNNFTKSWTVTQPGALRMRFIISYMNTESCCDRLTIYNSNNSSIDTFAGTRTGTSNSAAGNTLKATLTTDSSTGSVGFTVSGFEWAGLGAFNYRLAANSTILDLGSNLEAPSEDADGHPRPHDGDFDGTATTDPGAYEWHANVPPLAIGANELTVLPNTAVSFDASRSRDQDGTIASYAWDFGDGDTATGVTATHTYAAVGTYTVRLTVTDDKGATGVDTAVVTVAGNLPPTASAGPDQFVEPSTVVTLDASGSRDSDGTLVSYAWDFGDGTPAGSGRTVTHTYSREGIFTATLTVTDDRGLTATDTVAVVVRGIIPNAAPVANAGGSRAVTLGNATPFDGSGSSDSDGTLASYSWNFGDGTTGTGSRVDHTYAAEGTYLVVLAVVDNRGARDEDSIVVTVNAPPRPPNAVPVAEAGPAQSVVLGQTVALDGSASTDSDGTLVSYAWDFGDGTAASGQQVAHTYAAAGSYVVTLTVTDDRGASARDLTLVVVQTPQNARPVADAGSSRTLTLGDATSFDASGSTDSDGSLASYSWNFGDGTTGTGRTVSHTYAVAGIYLVTLTVVDDRGASDEDSLVVTVNAPPQPGNMAPVAEAGPAQTVLLGQAVAMDGSASTDADGTLASYGWDFGDGTVATGRQVAHTYATAGSYVVTLVVTDDKGASGRDTTLVTVQAPQNARPVADAGGSRTVTLGDASTFDASGSTDSDGTLASYTWNFGDGTTVSGKSLSHTYAAAGTYLVTLTVVDDRGASDEDSLVVTVTAPPQPGNAAPVAEAGPAQTVLLGQTVALDGSASSDKDGTLASYTWDFGDGTAASGAQVRHTYAAAGSYVVTLTVTDDKGATGYDVTLVVVQAPQNARPVAEAGSSRTLTLGDVTTLDASGSADSDGTLASYTWNFGDGTTGTGRVVNHTYAAAGTYLVRLLVVDDRGASDEDSLVVTVNAPPQPVNQLPVAEAGPGQTVTLGQVVDLDGSASTDTDGSIASYAWNFGDGTTGLGRNLSHSYTAVGTYLVTLTVVDNQGARDEDSLVVTVNPVPQAPNEAPVAEAGPAQTVVLGQPVDLDGSASTDQDGSIASYAWDFGNGKVATGAKVRHTYAAVGTYVVTLVVTDDKGATGRGASLVVVQAPPNAQPVAKAGGSRTLTLGAATAFDASGSTDTDGTLASYSWNFGDGTTSTRPSTSHTYAAAGTYLVTLTVVDDQGARDEDSLVVTVTAPPQPGNAVPVAEAGRAQTVALGLAVDLDGSASQDADGTVASYAWDFGDGEVATGAQVRHTYRAAGSYVVTLVILDDKGASSRDLTLVVVEAPRNARPVAKAGGPYSALLGGAVTLDGSASRDSDGAIAAYAWDFGDGTRSSEERPSHTYAAAGNYLVRLTVSDHLGATAEDTALVTISEPRNTPPVARAGGNRQALVGQELAFEASGSSDADGRLVSFAWDFGDGSTANGASAPHAYAAAGTYLVRLTVTDDQGAIGQDAALVTVGSPANRAPVADAGKPRTLEFGVPAQLDARGSFDADGTLASYAWDFGDEQRGTGAQVQHTYARPGSYLVRLTVTDNQGATAEDVVLITVAAAVPPNAVPVAEAGQDVSGHGGQPLTFSAAASTDGDGQLIAYQWDFGDGTSGSGLSAAHAYQAGGSYTVTLTVIDNAGARATDSLQVHVNALPQPEAGAARSGDVGQELGFDASASKDADGTIAAYAWDFGDGARATGAQATHAYAEPGLYTVRLTVTDDKGATSRAEALVVINRPLPAPLPPADTGCASAPGSTSAVTLLSLALALGFAARRRRA